MCNCPCRARAHSGRGRLLRRQGQGGRRAGAPHNCRHTGSSIRCARKPAAAAHACGAPGHHGTVQHSAQYSRGGLAWWARHEAKHAAAIGNGQCANQDLAAPLRLTCRWISGMQSASGERFACWRVAACNRGPGGGRGAGEAAQRGRRGGGTEGRAVIHRGQRAAGQPAACRPARVAWRCLLARMTAR